MVNDEYIYAQLNQSVVCIIHGKLTPGDIQFSLSVRSSEMFQYLLQMKIHCKNTGGNILPLLVD